jgi:Zn-finger nucleic acid-binding protein
MSNINKPSRNEDEYAVKHDAELIEETREIETARHQAEERRRHLMKCPRDGYDLATHTLHGVQVETCSHCGGMWLDKGELKTLIEHEEKGLLRRITNDLLTTFSHHERKGRR